MIQRILRPHPHPDLLVVRAQPAVGLTRISRFDNGRISLIPLFLATSIIARVLPPRAQQATGPTIAGNSHLSVIEILGSPECQLSLGFIENPSTKIV